MLTDDDDFVAPCVIVSESWPKVITIASVLDKLDPSAKIKVRLIKFHPCKEKPSNGTGNFQDVSVSDVKKHPDYSDINLKNNLARLDISASNDLKHSACFPTSVDVAEYQFEDGSDQNRCWVLESRMQRISNNEVPYYLIPAKVIDHKNVKPS